MPSNYYHIPYYILDNYRPVHNRSLVQLVTYQVTIHSRSVDVLWIDGGMYYQQNVSFILLSVSSASVVILLYCKHMSNKMNDGSCRLDLPQCLTAFNMFQGLMVHIWHFIFWGLEKIRAFLLVKSFYFMSQLWISVM